MHDKLREAQRFVRTMTAHLPDGPCPTPDCTGGCAVCRLDAIRQYFEDLVAPRGQDADTREEAPCERCGGLVPFGTKKHDGEWRCSDYPDCAPREQDVGERYRETTDE